MAARDPLWLMDGATALVDAEEARLGNSAAWETGASAVKVTSGVVPAVATPLHVHQTVTASANLLVEAGQAVIQGTTSATQGGYTATLDAQLTVTYLGTYPADAQPRKDIIIARINDKAYAGSTASFTIEVVKGTASGSPVDPALPASCIALARINLPASATTVADAVIDDLRSYTSAVGGLTVCTSTARPANVYDGFAVYETDKDRVMIYNGSGWAEPKATIPSVTAVLASGNVTTSGTTPLALVTSPTIVADGATPVVIRISGWYHIGSVAGDRFEYTIVDGVTTLATFRYTVTTGSIRDDPIPSGQVVPVPAAGSHAYTVYVTRVFGTGTLTVANTPLAPFTLTVEQFR